MTTETKEFAAQYPRDPDTNWILFPRDVEERRKLFPDRVFEHPAKANLTLVRELGLYLTKPGDTILDPFGGTGSQLISAWDGRGVVLIEIEEHFQDLIKETMEAWGKREPPPTGRMMLFGGDTRQKLQEIQFLCDAAIFSPPYSTAMGQKTGLKEVGRSNSSEALGAYSGQKANALNIGRLNPFFYEQALDTVFKRLAARLVPGAPVAVITKDTMKGTTRTMITESNIRRANRAGLELQEWHKWKPPGSAQLKIMKSKGANVVEDEDIIIFRKK